MTLTVAAMVMFFQDAATAQEHDVHWIMIFFAILATGFVLLCVGLLVVAALGWKLLKRVDSIANHVDQTVSPLLKKSTALIDELTPKVHDICTNAQQVSYTVREKVDDLAATVEQLNNTMLELNARARTQVVRVDGMVTEALDTTEQVSRTVQENIKKPVRQMAGIIAGLRAGLETLIERSPFRPRGGATPYDL